MAASPGQAVWPLSDCSRGRGGYQRCARLHGHRRCAVALFKQRRYGIRSDAHEGGYAKVSPGLREFILAFEAVQGVPLEPVYTGKLLYRIYRDLKQGQAHGSIVALHTGGLQGRRGFDF